MFMCAFTHDVKLIKCENNFKRQLIMRDSSIKNVSIQYFLV